MSMFLGSREFIERVTPPPANRRTLRRWGDPVMTAWGYSTEIVGTSNWQNIACWTDINGHGAITNYLWIEREWIDYLKSIQFAGYNRVGEWHDERSKMNWLCRDGHIAIYLDAGEWETLPRIKWGTTTIGGNYVTVEEYRVRRVWDKARGQYADLEMARLRGFRKADRGRPLANLLAEGIVHECHCAGMGDTFVQTPKGIVYSPLWSVEDFDFGGAVQPDGLWVPSALLE